MTIVIVNNYFKKENLGKAAQIAHSLRKVGKSKHEIWVFSEISEKKIQNDVEAVVLSGSAARLQNQDHASMYTAEIELVTQVEVPVLGYALVIS